MKELDDYIKKFEDGYHELLHELMTRKYIYLKDEIFYTNIWINVKEKLPNNLEKDYLVFQDGKIYLAEIYEGIDGKFWYTCGDQVLKPSHWMPLPKTPENA